MHRFAFLIRAFKPNTGGFAPHREWLRPDIEVFRIRWVRTWLHRNRPRMKHYKVHRRRTQVNFALEGY